jgi:ATP-dependent Clp protease protease subunit
MNTMNLVPIVIEKTGSGERAFDIFSRLLSERIVFLNGAVDDASASLVIAQILHLESADSEKDIHFYINSPGGVITSGMAIYDVMQFVKPNVCTYVMGQACSMGSFLAQAGSEGKRYMLPHARHMIHQPSGGTRGMQSDIEIQYKEITQMKSMLTKLYVEHNTAGKTYEEFERDMDRDTFMSAEEALTYGLCDKIIEKR